MIEAIQAIRNKAIAEWKVANPTVPIFFQNEPNNIPSGSPFIYVEVIGDDAGMAAFGGGPGANEWDQLGYIQAHILVPGNKGVDVAYRLADDFAVIFRGQRFNSVTCRAANVRGGDRSADHGNFWQLTVVVNFEYRYKG